MSFIKRGALKLFFHTLFLFFNLAVFAQNTSNEGTDFWVAYTGHVDGTESRLTLFLTSKVNTVATITIGGVPYAGGPVSISANKAIPIYINPNVYTNTYVDKSDGIAINHGIHVTSVNPIVLYSHISRGARSAATMVLPTKALGSEYYAMAYNQMASVNATLINPFELRVSEFTVLGVEANTTVEITLPPGVNSTSNLAHSGGSTYTIFLNRGDVYQFQSTTDVSGVKIRTIGNCTPIAVFSGSTKAGFCEEPGSIRGSGQDNLYQQLFPLGTWGKQYITAPFYNALNGVKDIIRIFVSEDNTNITINGSPINPAGGMLTNLPKGSIITFASSNPNRINADKPISVAQIQVSQSCNPNNSDWENPVFPGDPELTLLNSIEQTLTDITVYSAVSVSDAPTNIVKHYLNVIIKNEDIPSLTIDNIPVPAANFSPIDAEYSYLIYDVTVSSAIDPTHRIKANGGFLAIAYGYGVYESYAYLAGSDIKNLNQFIKFKDPVTNLEVNSGCTQKGLTAEITLPYQTTELIWDFGNGQPEIVQPSPVFDHQIINDGVILYVYKYQLPVNYTSPGIKNIVVKSFNPGVSLCGDYDEIKLIFEIFELPRVLFTVNSSSCVNSGLIFTDQSQAGVGFIKKWIWDFKNGQVIEKDSADPFSYNYTQIGDFEPVLTLITQNGCSISSSPQPVHISPVPVAEFSYYAPNCEQQLIRFADLSTATEGNIIQWIWDFGDNQTSSDKNPEHVFALPGTYMVSLKVLSDIGCESINYSLPITIYPLPLVDFSVPDICLDDPGANFANLSTQVDGSTTGLNYLWDFGDTYSDISNPNTSNIVNPSHQFTREGNYQISLTVTTAAGCAVTLSKPFRVNGVNPKAEFEIINENNLCSSNAVSFKNKSYVAGFGEITRLEWYFDYLNQPGQVYVDEEPTPDKIYSFSYPVFNSPASKNYAVRLVAYSGGVCVSPELIKTINIKAVPEVIFDDLGSVCLEISPFQITQARELHNFLGNYQFSGPGVSATGLFKPALAGVGTHQIKYVFTAQNGCTDSLTKSISVYPSPTVILGQDIAILSGDSLRFNPSVSGTNLVYSWSPSVGLSQSDILNPLVTPLTDTRYVLTVRSDQGCVAADEVFIRVLQMPEVPNAFTPNGDGINDLWNIKYLDTYTDATVEVFNRYGQQIFYSRGYSVGWDGRYKGNEIPLGTYYYIVRPGSGRKPITGSITVIR